MPREKRPEPIRTGTWFAHVVGYSTHGKLGVESAANFNLLRSNSFFLERIVNEIRGEKNKGDDVVTTLNVSLQQAAYDALGEHDGAVVVMEPSTGRILAMVSKPDFDPNEVAGKLGSNIRRFRKLCFSQPCDTGTIPAGFYF